MIFIIGCGGLHQATYNEIVYTPLVPEHVLLRAVSFWEDHGYSVFDVRGGSMVVTVDTEELDYFSTKEKTAIGLSRPIGANCVIFLREADDSLTLAHEIGHCIGLSHTPESPWTIMHPEDLWWDVAPSLVP